jgi:hypothetical protein
MAGIVLSSVPVLTFGIAQVATSGSAGAAGSTTCTGAGALVTFAPPGLSDLGTASISAKSITKTGSAAMSCTNGTTTTPGTLSAGKIVSKSTTLCQNDTNPPNPCPTGEYVYDSVAQLASSASTLYKSDKSTSWVIKGVTYKTANTGSSTAGTGTGVGLCPSGEVGFVLTGHLVLPSSQLGKSTEITACLNTDTGPNTTGSFAADVTSEAGGNTSITIQTSTLDGATSSIVFA